MALNLGVLTVQIGADVSQLVQGFQQAGRMVRLLETQFMDMQKTTAQLTTTMNQAATATKVVGTNAQNAAKGIANVGHGSRGAGDEVQTLTQRLTNMSNRIHIMFGGAAMTAAFTMPFIAFGKAALNSTIEFESAFAGVRKTVNATELEFATLSKRFREMSQEMPVTAEEFSRIGELAGQLGVRGVRDISQFSEVIAKLRVAAPALDLDEAATGLARFSNIMGTPISQADRMSATIVDLGNNFATFEDEMLEFALRIAGAGKQIGLTEAQVLAFGTAMSSVGIRAEAGGTAIQRVFMNIKEAVTSGGAKLQKFSEVANTSMEGFRDLFQRDAAEAVTIFIEGLQRIPNVFEVLKDLDVNEQRVLRTLLSTAGAGDLLRRTLDKAAKAWTENNALNEEAAKRFGTTASQIQILRNTWDEFLRQTGELAIPMLTDLMGTLKGVVKSMQDWDNETKKAVVGLGALLAVVGPLMLGLSLTGAAISGWQKMLEILGISAAVANKVLLLAGAIFTLTKAFKEGVVELKSWWTELDKVQRMGGRFNWEVLIPRPFAAIRPQDFFVDPSKQFTQHDIDAEVERFQRAAETFRRIQKQQSGSTQTTTTGVEQQVDALIMLEAALKDLATQTAIYTAQTSGIGTTAETIAKQQEILTTTLLKQEIQVVLLNKRYEDSSNTLGEYAEDTLKAKDALDKARISEAQTAAELKSLARALDQLKLDRAAYQVQRLDNAWAIFQTETKGAAETAATLIKQKELLESQIYAVQQQVGLLTSSYDQSEAALGLYAQTTMELGLALDNAKQRLVELHKELAKTKQSADPLTVLTAEARHLESELQVFEITNKKVANSASYSAQRQELLQKAIEAQQQVAQHLETQYTAVIEQFDASSEAALLLRQRLDDARLALARLQDQGKRPVGEVVVSDMGLKVLQNMFEAGRAAGNIAQQQFALAGLEAVHGVGVSQPEIIRRETLPIPGVAATATAGAGAAAAGSAAASNVVQHVGTIRVEGVNNQGEMVGVVDIITSKLADHLRGEQERYPPVRSTFRTFK